MERTLQQTETALPSAKYTLKDSVFTALFQDTKYLIQLYRALHPKDAETKEDSLTNISLRKVLMNGLHNDLGFMAGDKLMILAEAQSTWTMNIIVRALIYLAQSCQDYLKKEKADLYRSKKVKLPKPELYVIFTGERVDKPEYIFLSEEFFGGERCAIEVQIKMIYGDDSWETSGSEAEQDIISQYIIFTKVYTKQCKLYGRNKKAVEETIRICKDMNVLKEFLESREKEVTEIMLDLLYDEKYIWEAHDYNLVKDAKEEATKEAEEKAAKAAAEKLLKTGKLAVEEIAACLSNISVEDIRKMKEDMVKA